MSLIQRLLRAAPPGKSNLIGGRIVALAVGLMFGGGGGAIFWQTSLGPILTNLEAQNWPQVEGAILSSEMVPDSDGDRKLDITYSYQIDSITYKGDGYNPTDTHRNFGRKSITDAQAKYTAGKIVQVWVNPEDHSESLLDRSIKLIAWMGLFFATPFLTVGFCGVGWALLGGTINRRCIALRQLAAKKAEKVGSYHIANRLNDEQLPNDEIITFLDGDDRLGGVTLLALSLFWSGIVGCFLFIMLMMLLSGELMAVFLFFFLIPFVWIGSYLLTQTFKNLSGPRCPDYVIWTSPREPVPDKMTIDLHWAFIGKTFDLSRVKNITVCMTRGNGWISLKKRRPRSESGEQNYVINLASATCGQTTIHLPAVETDRFSTTFQGTIELTSTWKIRAENEHCRTFTLGQTSSND